MPVTLRLAEDADVSATTAIRTQRWGDKTFWTDRITWYLRGEHSPRPALSERAAFVVDGEEQCPSAPNAVDDQLCADDI